MPSTIPTSKRPVSVLVPTNVTLAEHKFATGPRKLTLVERIGIQTMFPQWHRHWVKQSRSDTRSILTKSYDGAEDDEVKDILLTRQRAVHNKMVTRTFGLFGSIMGPIGAMWTFQHYNDQGKRLPLIFLAYGGNLTGRAFGGWWSGRWAAPLREVSLGNLPAHRFLRADEASRHDGRESGRRERTSQDKRKEHSPKKGTREDRAQRRRRS